MMQVQQNSTTQYSIPYTRLLSNKLEQSEFKLEKTIGIQKHAEKVRKGPL